MTASTVGDAIVYSPAALPASVEAELFVPGHRNRGLQAVHGGRETSAELLARSGTGLVGLRDRHAKLSSSERKRAPV
jgi:hypothetical protein